jgi:hypothetical protein
MTTYQRFTSYLRRSRIRKRTNSYPKYQTALPTAGLAECTCPEFCERDHDNE